MNRRARTYAIELQEIKKIKNKIAGAKLAMEQIKLRLGTVSKLGDIVVTLSPCMSLIKGLTPSISRLMPQMNASMQDLPNMLEDMLTDSTLSPELMTTSYQGNADTECNTSRSTVMFLREEHKNNYARTTNYILTTFFKRKRIYDLDFFLLI